MELTQTGLIDSELRERSFNTTLDQYLVSGTMTAEQYASLTPSQRAVIQCIKRAFARITTDDVVKLT